MRLFCVTNAHHQNKNCPKPIVGSEYNSVDEDKEDGILYYELAEFPKIEIGGQVNRFLFNSKGFATLPSIAEEIAVECEREAIIYQR